MVTLALCPGCGLQRRCRCSSVTVLIPVAMITCTIYLIWHLHLLPLDPADPAIDSAAPSGPGQYYRHIGQPIKGQVGEIEVENGDNLQLRVVGDLETKCERQSLYVETDSDGKDLIMCPCVPPGLDGKKLEIQYNFTEEEVITMHPELDRGGRWAPPACTARQRLCVLVPYRNRSRHVMPFMDYIHDRLQKQQRDYAIYLIEQSEGSRFNRGLLFNIGFYYATNTTLVERPCDCVILHDIDMVAEDDRNLYMCPEGGALHLAAYRRHLNYSLPYVGYFGGITAVRADDYRGANGYSNMYFGWGSEDDEFLQRLFATGVKLLRHLPEVSKVTMMEHAQVEPNRERLMLYLRWKERWSVDGLNSVNGMVEVTDVEERHLYTWIRVDIKEEKVKRTTSELLFKKRSFSPDRVG